MLKIDLLPRHFAIARFNKKLAAGAVILLIAAVGFWLFRFHSLNATIDQTQQDLDEQTVIAEKVRGYEREISQKQSELDPIQAKVDFVTDADNSGGQFFDRFHAINKYIMAGARMSEFSVSGSSVEFTVTVRGTLGVARFLLNLLGCPDITNISYSGIPGGGQAIGAAAMRPPGMMAPGMSMLQPTVTVAGAGPGGPDQEIPLRITATLTEPTTVPSPPGAGERAPGARMAPGM